MIEQRRLIATPLRVVTICPRCECWCYDQWTMFGTFPTSFEAAIQPYVKGKRVVDLGAGDCTRAVILAGLGGAVLAVDRQFDGPPVPGTVNGLQLLDEADFHDAGTGIDSWRPDVAHLAWPHESNDQSLVSLLRRCEFAIYVGKNTDESSCGNPYLFQYLRAREVLVYVPDPTNVLIVYGRHLGYRRTSVHYEEMAGLRQYELRRFSDAMRLFEVSDDNLSPIEQEQPTSQYSADHPDDLEPRRD